MNTKDITDQYQDFKNGIGFCTDTRFRIIEMTGKDRASFLHNFCTADIKKLNDGDSVEAFVLNTKGKTIGFIQVLCQPNSLAILAQENQVAALLAHLSKYVIAEDVELRERTDQTVVICGFDNFENLDAKLFRIGLSPRSTCIIANDIESVTSILISGGKSKCSADSIEMARVENGFPYGGIDVLDDNLAQEFNRDETAISYVKGCYLGQETVARLDALGHTNRSFVRARIEGKIEPEVGAELQIAEKTVGKISSVAYSPENQCFMVLAVLKKPNHQSGTHLSGHNFSATVL